MINQWEGKNKKKFYLITAFLLVLIISGGIYAYTFTTAIGTIDIAAPTGDIATTNATATQPDWNSILTANTTCGEVPTGDIFSISPNPVYTGDILASIHLMNVGSLIKAYQYLNIEVYVASSVSANETPNYRLLTLQNGQATFSLLGLSATSDTWTQTSQADFEGGTLNQLDTTTSPGDVTLAIFTDNVTDSYDDQTRIAASANVTVSGGQVKLSGTVGSTGTETLRPSAAGDETNISNQFPATGAHWDKVDEATSDNYTTYVYTNSTTYQRDLYDIPAHSTGLGEIDDVTVYFQFANSASSTDSTKYAIAYEGSGNDGYVTTVDMSTSGNITDTVLDTLEFDITTGLAPSIIHVSGNVSAIAYEDASGDGILKTIEIASDGQITDMVIDTLEFDILDGHEPDIIHVSGNVYAIAYEGPTTDGFLKTVEIATNGQITDTVIDTLEFDIAAGLTPHIIPVSGDVYAIAYEGDGGDGFLTTVEIATNGQITDTILDTLEFDTSDGDTPNIIHASGDIYAIAYEGKLGDGFLKTVEIATNGQITDTIIDTLEFDTLDGNTPSITPVSGNVYAIVYDGVLGDGFLKTVEIATNGQITDTVVDTLEFDTLDGHEPDIIHVSGDIYSIAYEGVGTSGFLKTVEIATNGQITDTVIDTLEFDTLDGIKPNIIFLPHVPGNIYARATLKTNGTVSTGTEESTSSNSFVSRSYQWTTNPDTGSQWTWTEIDALQIGLELRTGYNIDTAVCTQVYIEVNYTETTYNSPGTITSINLLSAEKASSIDTFDYNASSIPSGTGLKIQYSQDNSNWYNSAGTPDGWDTLSQGTNNIDLSGLTWSGSNFYYHIEFTSDGSATPIMDEISVIFSTYYASGDLTSSTYDAGSDDAWDWQNITFTITEPSTTDINFQLRSASTEGGLSTATWYGPTGTGDYYTTSGTLINSVHDGDRWIQYKAYFSGPGDYTPTFSDISISYTAPASAYTVEIIGGGYCLISDNSSEWGSGWSVTPEFYCEATQR